MDLKKLQPNDILSSPETGIQELMRNFLMRTNFVPGVRHVIGWRGLKDSSAGVVGWTAKIKGFSGVFGIYFDELKRIAGWINGRFAVDYFPHPGEDLVELFSLQASICTRNDEYLMHVRDFLSYTELRQLFSIGIIDLGVHQSGEALILGLESISRQRVIAKDGISFSQDGPMIELVRPGGFDQDFPSYNTAIAFYRVLSASITFALEEPPSYLKYVSQPGNEIVYDSSGNLWEEPSGDAKQEYLYLGYGKAQFESDIARLFKKGQSSIRNVSWEKGDAILTDYKDELWWNAHTITDFKTLDKRTLGIDDRPQFIVVTGFLGSGKTSFLRNYIEYHVQHNRFVAIIQNEIGEVGLDGKLLDHDYSVTEIDEGCVCCTLIGRLKNAVRQILSHFHPDYVVLETTGVADPYNLLHEISEVDELVRFDSITTVVDGLNLHKSLEEHELIRKQIEAADILLLNKKDLLTEAKTQELSKELRGINPTAPILLTEHGDVNPALLYDTDPPDTKEIKYKIVKEAKGRHVQHSHGQYLFSSYKIPFSKPVDRDLFLDGIRSLPHTIFRIKGVVDFHDFEKPLLFQYVRGRFEFSEFNNPKITDRFIILIGQDIKREPIDSFFCDRLSGDKRS